MLHAALDTIPFDDPHMGDALERASPEQFEHAPFGIVELDRDSTVVIYNQFEQQLAGLSPDDVIGRDFFVDVAPCTNNFLVRERFIDAWDRSVPLDAMVPYTFSYRMKATRVLLRLLVRGERGWMLVKLHGR